MAVRNGVGGACFHAVSTEDAAVVVDVINLGVALSAAYALLGSIFGSLNVDAVRRAICRAQETGHALLQTVFVALQHVHAAKTLLKHSTAQGAGAIRVIFHLRGLEHLPKRDTHALGNSGYVFEDRHVFKYTDETEGSATYLGAGRFHVRIMSECT